MNSALIPSHILRLAAERAVELARAEWSYSLTQVGDPTIETDGSVSVPVVVRYLDIVDDVTNLIDPAPSVPGRLIITSRNHDLQFDAEKLGTLRWDWDHATD